MTTRRRSIHCPFGCRRIWWWWPTRRRHSLCVNSCAGSQWKKALERSTWKTIVWATECTRCLVDLGMIFLIFFARGMWFFINFGPLSKIPSSWYKAADGQDPVPVTFRYVVKPSEGYVTHVFRPKGCDPSSDTTYKHQSLGGLYKENLDKVIWNKRAALTWEAHTRECSCGAGLFVCSAVT